MTIEDIQKEWREDRVIDGNHLDAASENTPLLHSKYLDIYAPARLKHKTYEIELRKLKRLKFRYYRGELTKEELEEHGWNQWQGAKPLKNEMEEFLCGDEDLCKLEMKVEYYKVMVDTVNSILGAIKQRDWQIKNSIVWKQFISGN